MTINYHQGAKEDAYEITRLYFEGTGRFASEPMKENCLDNYPSVVATLEGRIVGFAYTLQFSPEILRLDNMFVCPGLRRRGVGTEIVTRLEKIIPVKYTHVILDNSLLYEYPRKDVEKHSAKAFYEKLGYRTVIETPNTVVLVKEIRKPL